MKRDNQWKVLLAHVSISCESCAVTKRDRRVCEAGGRREVKGRDGISDSVGAGESSNIKERWKWQYRSPALLKYRGTNICMLAYSGCCVYMCINASLFFFFLYFLVYKEYFQLILF